MRTILTTEMFWLVCTILMTSLFWLPYIVNRMLEQGVLAALWDRFGRTETNKDWARRMMQAHENAVENLVIFAPLVILIQITGLNSETTATACMIYFFARLLHYVVLSLAIPLLRVMTFLTGFAIQVVLALVLLGVI
jgi:uncharacterized MAPEG superfamily protein